jgi:hypothetical protein
MPVSSTYALSGFGSHMCGFAQASLSICPYTTEWHKNIQHSTHHLHHISPVIDFIGNYHIPPRYTDAMGQLKLPCTDHCSDAMDFRVLGF